MKGGARKEARPRSAARTRADRPGGARLLINEEPDSAGRGLAYSHQLKGVIHTGATVMNRLFGSKSRRVLVTHWAVTIAAVTQNPRQAGGPKWT